MKCVSITVAFQFFVEVFVSTMWNNQELLFYGFMMQEVVQY